MVDPKSWHMTKSGHMVDTRRTRFGGTAKADTLRTHGGQSGETLPKRNQGRDKADNGGQALGTRPEHIAANLFLLRENPTVKLFGEKPLLGRTICFEDLFPFTPRAFRVFLPLLLDPEPLERV